MIAGIGNVYRAELLFRHRVEPFLPGRQLPAQIWTRCGPTCVTLMTAGVRTGQIVTVRTEDKPRASAVR